LRSLEKLKKKNNNIAGGKKPGGKNWGVKPGHANTSERLKRRLKKKIDQAVISHHRLRATIKNRRQGNAKKRDHLSRLFDFGYFRQ